MIGTGMAVGPSSKVVASVQPESRTSRRRVAKMRRRACRPQPLLTRSRRVDGRLARRPAAGNALAGNGGRECRGAVGRAVRRGQPGDGRLEGVAAGTGVPAYMNKKC